MIARKATNKIIFLLGLLSMITLSACAPKPPPSFVQINDTALTHWKTIEIRKGLEYETAWKTLVDVVAIRWDIETMEKDAGYLRSAWAYATGIDRGVNQPFTYGRRLSANFTEDHTKLQIKTEAAYQVPGYATIYGVDSAFNDDVFSEISGKLGRTAR